MPTSNSKAILGAIANGSNSRSKVSGIASIGIDTHQVNFPNSDIAYNLTITSAASGNVATLNLATGTVAQTTGSPVITDAGVDFEGKTLTAASKVNAVHIEFESVQSNNIITSGIIAVTASDDKQEALLAIPDGKTTPATLAVTFSAANQKVNITVLAQS